MASVYWKLLCPLAALHQRIQHLVTDLLRSRDRATLWVSSDGMSPITAIQVQETATTIVFTANIPQIATENLKIRVTPEILSVRGEQREQIDIPGYCSFTYPAERFHSLIPLPHPVRPDAAIAEIQGTQLTVILAKAEGDSYPDINIHGSNQLLVLDGWSAGPR